MHPKTTKKTIQKQTKNNTKKEPQEERMLIRFGLPKRSKITPQNDLKNKQKTNKKKEGKQNEKRAQLDEKT